MRASLVAVVCATLVTGCFSFRYRDPRVAPRETHDAWTSHFFWGLVGREVVDVRAYCGEAPVAEVATGSNFGTWIVNAVTLGLYSPKKVYVTCGARELPERASR